MDVWGNVSVGLGKAEDRRALAGRVREVSQADGLPLDPELEVHTLSVGERQRIEIVRCLLQNPSLLIMDEPTSVLTPQEVERLFDTLRKLASEGVSRSEEHTSELQSLMRISYAVFCLKKKNKD